MRYTILPEAELAQQLQELYDQVPATRCQSTGECCRLTPEEYDNHYATMFPLHRAEYANIARHVAREMPGERRELLLSFTEERPMRCPFLDAENRCTIYGVRPLICRTYGVMNPDTIAHAAVRHQGRLPDDWIKAFVRRESSMVCPRVRVTEPGKLERHVDNLLSFTYERELLRLSQTLELDDPERLRIFRAASGRRSWPMRWSWGGYNALCRMSLEWLQQRFDDYWSKAELADAG